LITVFLAVLCQGLIVWVSETYLPETFLAWAPMILLGILVATLLLGALKLLVGIALATINPIIGVLYTFFFANMIGKQLTKSVLTTALLTALVYAMNEIGILTISIAVSALIAYLPFLIILAVAWYLINKI
jgi:hypothetical protein